MKLPANIGINIRFKKPDAILPLKLIFQGICNDPFEKRTEVRSCK
jgi:hypothetical protein